MLSPFWCPRASIRTSSRPRGLATRIRLPRMTRRRTAQRTGASRSPCKGPERPAPDADPAGPERRGRLVGGPLLYWPNSLKQRARGNSFMTKETPMRTHDSPRGADHWLSFAALVLRRVVAASCDGARPTGHGHKATNSGLLG